MLYLDNVTMNDLAADEDIQMLHGMEFRVIDMDGNGTFYSNDENALAVHRGLVQLYTGFKDRYGQRIYVGDKIALGDGRNGIVTSDILLGRSMHFAIWCLIDKDYYILHKEPDYLTGNECKWELCTVTGRVYEGCDFSGSGWN